MDNTTVNDTQMEVSTEENVLLIAPAPTYEEASEEITEGMGVNFAPENFVTNLSYMGVGMLGIFIVIGIICATTVVLNKIFSSKKKEDTAE